MLFVTFLFLLAGPAARFVVDYFRYSWLIDKFLARAAVNFFATQ